METVRWVLGVLLLLAGVGSFTDNFGQALAYIAIGGALLPPVIPFIQQRFFRSSSENHDDIDFEITITDDDEDKPPYNNDSVVEKDAWEADGWDFDTAVPLDATIEIKYTDGNGLETSRIVDVKYCSFTGNNDMFKGYCHLREANRTFRISRVQQAVDVSTGEIIDDLSVFLREKYEQSDHFALTNAFDKYYDNLRALLYVGKADGQLRRGERAVLYEFMQQITGRESIPENTLKYWADGIDLPSLAAFRQVVGRIAKQEKDLIEMTLRAAEDMSGTNKNAKPAELEAIEYMRKRFGIS